MSKTKCLTNKYSPYLKLFNNPTETKSKHVSWRLKRDPVVLYKQSKAELAEKCSTIAIAYLQKRNDPDCPMMASALNTLGTVCSHLKKFGDAKTALLKAKEIRAKLNGSKHESVAVIDNNLGRLCVELKDFAAARRHYDSALQTWTRCLGQDHPLVAKV